MAQVSPVLWPVARARSSCDDWRSRNKWSMASLNSSRPEGGGGRVRCSRWRASERARRRADERWTFAGRPAGQSSRTPTRFWLPIGAPGLAWSGLASSRCRSLWLCHLQRSAELCSPSNLRSEVGEWRRRPLELSRPFGWPVSECGSAPGAASSSSALANRTGAPRTTIISDGNLLRASLLCVSASA